MLKRISIPTVFALAALFCLAPVLPGCGGKGGKKSSGGPSSIGEIKRRFSAPQAQSQQLRKLLPGASAARSGLF